MRKLHLFLIAFSFVLFAPKIQAQEKKCSGEPNIEEALGWWPAPRNVWTPLGWKSHLFRFQVVYNGTPPPMPHENTKVYKMDGGIGVQHWRDNLAAPVLCSDWPMQDGVVMRSEVFTHMKGGGEVVTGTEPLYAWVRLSVAYVHPIRPPEKYFFTV